MGVFDFFGFCGLQVGVSEDLMTPLDRARRVLGGLLVFFCGLVTQANRHGKYSNRLLTFLTLKLTYLEQIFGEY